MLYDYCKAFDVAFIRQLYVGHKQVFGLSLKIIHNVRDSGNIHG